MRGGRVLRSARASLALTGEEQDQLDRSKKKAKRSESPETMVEETQEIASTGKEGKEEGSAQQELFQIVIGDSLKRPVISYKDACLGVNGASNYISSSDWESFDEEESYEGSDEDSGSDNGEEMDEDGELKPGAKNRVKDDPLCPTIKVTKGEVRVACQPWKKAILVKLLGKRLGMRFLRQRLIKMWQPSGAMEMIDLENDYFLIRFSNVEDLNGRIYKVEYEGLHLICFHCGRYGHRREACPTLPSTGVVTANDDGEKENHLPESQPNPPPTMADGGKADGERGEIFGSWMIAQRKSRKFSNSKKGVDRGASGADNGEDNRTGIAGPGRYDLLREDTTAVHEEDPIKGTPNSREETNLVPKPRPARKLTGVTNDSAQSTPGQRKANMAGPSHAKDHVDDQHLGSQANHVTSKVLRKMKLLAREGGTTYDQEARQGSLARVDNGAQESSRLTAPTAPRDPPLEPDGIGQGDLKSSYQQYLSGRPPDGRSSTEAVNRDDPTQGDMDVVMEVDEDNSSSQS
ncbi:Zinc finger, CCHC-type [Sesbania bispinosa]|nr:Zinc finger, CCHC-type [Sesbania bispinosa]